MTEFQQIVINLVNEGLTVSQIAKKLSKNTSSVSSVVKRFGLTPVKAFENTVDSTFFDVINTEEKAYLLGFFIADGCINTSTDRSKGRFAINQSIDDLEIVEAFKKCLNVPSDIQYINSQTGVKNRKVQCRLRWTSTHMEETLTTKYHITPKKTQDSLFYFPIADVPENLQGHFVRGFIDGDGYMGDNGKEGNFSISIVGTSVSFLETIGDLISKATGMTYSIYSTRGKTCEYHSLRWSCEHVDKLNKIKKLQNYLYNNATIFLRRKKEKIDHYIEYRANYLCNSKQQCNAQEMNLETEYNSPTSAQPLTGKAEGENIC